MTAKIIPLRKTTAPPRKLGKHGRQLWDAVTGEVVVEDAAGIEMLTLTCQALDRAENCREQIDRDGELLRTKAGIKENPLLKTELANRAFVVRTMSRLGLELDPVKAIGRPAGSFNFGKAGDAN
jgi:hypothetical protein